MDFTRTDLELDLEQHTHAFVADVVIPRERDARIGPHGPSEELRRELQASALSRGLLAPQLSPRFGGHGLNLRQTATVLRASGYSLLGPLAMNVMAPDEGNMYMLEKIATPRQLDVYLRPLALGQVR